MSGASIGTFAPYHLTQSNLAVEADRAFLAAQLKAFNETG